MTGREPGTPRQFASSAESCALLETNARLTGDIAKLFNDGWHERNAFAAADRLGLALGIARDERPRGPRTGPRSAERPDELVDLALELRGLDERVDPQRAEKVSDTFADRPRRDLLLQREGRRERAPVRAGKHGRQHVDHDREAVALVASAIAVGPERKERSAVDQRVRVCCRTPVPVYGPARRNGFAGASRDLDLPVRHGAGRHVDHDRRLSLTWERDGDRICPEPAFRTPQGRDERRRVRHCPADEIALEPLEHVPAGDPVVIAVADADPAAAGRERLLHGDGVRLWADHEAETVIAVDGRGARSLADDADIGLGVDATKPQHVEVRVQARDAVRVDAA